MAGSISAIGLGPIADLEAQISAPVPGHRDDRKDRNQS